MKDVFEATYRAVGEELDERLDFVQLDPNYRLYFHDGDKIDLHANMAQLAREVERVEPGASSQLFRFLADGARKYEMGMDFVVRNYDSLIDLANPKAGWRMLQTRALQNLYRQVSGYFDSDKLRKAFSFHSMFLGLSPFEAPAMYSLITYADLGLGMWYPRGGLYRLVEDMVELCRQRGVQFHFNQPVQQIGVSRGRVTGVETSSGFLAADLVVSNADLPYTYRSLVPALHRPSLPDSRIEDYSYACSGYLLYLGLDQRYPDLEHQGLFFAEDYKANLDAIFVDKTLPADPSFHINVPTVTDQSLAPPGHSLMYLLAPMPNLSAGIDWEQAGSQVREQLLRRLEQIVDPAIRQHIVWQRQYLPTDFKADYNAALGTAFGSLSHGFFQSSYFRPHNKAKDIQGLYFVGQGTYPGIGMPMVQLSAQLVVERIEAEC
jgi:phytoene desaturase